MTCGFEIQLEFLAVVLMQISQSAIMGEFRDSEENDSNPLLRHLNRQTSAISLEGHCVLRDRMSSWNLMGRRSQVEVLLGPIYIRTSVYHLVNEVDTEAMQY